VARVEGGRTQQGKRSRWTCKTSRTSTKGGHAVPPQMTRVTPLARRGTLTHRAHTTKTTNEHAKINPIWVIGGGFCGWLHYTSDAGSALAWSSSSSTRLGALRSTTVSPGAAVGRGRRFVATFRCTRRFVFGLMPSAVPRVVVTAARFSSPVFAGVVKSSSFNSVGLSFTTTGTSCVSFSLSTSANPTPAIQTDV
jgi:hypothetical protein